MRYKLVITAIGLAFVLLSAKGALSQYTYDVTYDENDLPHITAPTDKDGVYGQGFEMARAQGPLLYAVYAKAIGKEVKYFGGTHDLEDHRVKNDYRIALWRIPQMAKGTYRRMQRAEQTLLRAFCDGINDAMASSFVPPEWRDNYPGDMEDFVNGIEPWHVVATYMRYSFKPIVDRNVHGDPLEKEFDVRSFPIGNSNAWALLDGDGSAWLQIDPHNHLGPDEHLMTFGCSMNTDENFHWFGFNALGLPLMGVGVKLANPNVPGSQAIAWTATAAPPDMADVYLVPWNEYAWKYKFDGRWRRAGILKFTIEFPDPNDNWAFEVPYSQEHGPWIENSATDPAAFFGRAVWQVSPLSKDFMRQWNGMLKADNITEFFQAMEGMALHGGNFVIVTDSPNLNERINYILFNPTPDRTDVPNYQQIDWTAPVDGSLSCNVWCKVHPLSWLPRADGGDQDHFINCNCSIDITYQGFLQSPTQWPDYLTGGLGIYTYRQDRADQLWGDLVSVNESQMYEWVTDKSHGYARYNIPDLSAANDQWAGHPDIKDNTLLEYAMEMLEGWNMMATKNSQEMLLFRLWMAKFLKKGEYHVYFTFPSERPSIDIYDQTLCLNALNALVEAYDVWYDKNQAGKGTWGKNHIYLRLIEGGELNFELPGDGCCLRSAHGKWEADLSQQNIGGGQVVPMMVKLSLVGDPIIKYMKGKDNCTLQTSYMWNNDCPATSNWAEEVFTDF